MTSTTKHPPTAEQATALDLFATGKSLAIEAGAGAGKTSTLMLLADASERHGQYIAFNKAIVIEAGEKMPGNVACSTAHSLAYKATDTRMTARLRNSRRMKSSEIARQLDVRPITVVTPEGNDKKLSETFLAGLAMKAVTRFCQSADPEPAEHHVPYINGIDIPPGAMRNNRVVRRHLLPAVRRAWADLNDPRGSLPYRHDHYLKAWQLSGPRIGADFILFDEAQDANPVMVAIVAAQRHAQLVWVGDSQQQIYSFTGAVNALASVPADQRAFLTQSFRFGPAIAEVANRVLGDLGAELTLRGTESVPSTVGPCDDPDVILTRTNAEAVRAVLAARAEGTSVHLVGCGKDVVSFALAARDLQTGQRTDHPELACFDDWGEVQQYVAQDEQGGDLRLMVKLVDEFGIGVILEALDRTTSEAAASLVVSTAHKSKGREWNAVQLAGDFPAEPSGEELRLLYVAVTRARLRLDVSQVGYFLLAEHDAADDVADALGEGVERGRVLDAAKDEAGPIDLDSNDAGSDWLKPRVLVPEGNPAHAALAGLLARYPTREALDHRVRQLDAERDAINAERLLLVALLDPEKQAHYEERG